MDVGYRRFDLSVHMSRYKGDKDGSKYRDGFDRTEFPLDAIAELISQFCWSPIVWRGGIRKSENFYHSSLVALDFDTPFYTLKQAINDWCDTIHIIGTTHSHQKMKDGIKCDRFRIVSLWDQVITDPRCYRPSLMNLLRENRAQHADDKCLDLGRFFFPCNKIVSVVTDGEMIASVKEPPEIHRSPPTILTSLPARALKFLSSVAKPGERNWSSYKFAYDCARCGYKAENVIEWVIKSKTYANEKDERVISKEIPTTVLSAFKKFQEDLRGHKKTWSS